MTFALVIIAIFLVRMTYILAYHHGWTDCDEGRTGPVGWKRWLA